MIPTYEQVLEYAEYEIERQRNPTMSANQRTDTRLQAIQKPFEDNGDEVGLNLLNRITQHAIDTATAKDAYIGNKTDKTLQDAYISELSNLASTCGTMERHLHSCCTTVESVIRLVAPCDCGRTKCECERCPVCDPAERHTCTTYGIQPTSEV